MVIGTTEREDEILGLVREGINSPTELAEKLDISQPGASQALRKLAEKGKLIRRKEGKKVKYEAPKQNRDSELFFLAQAYNSLSQVWAFVISNSNQLTKEEMQRAREARETLERVLAKKVK